MTEPLQHRTATQDDAHWLAEMNYQLIRDMGHRNPMSVDELQARMATWLTQAYTAIIYEQGATPVAYALYRTDPDAIYLRQLFVQRDLRRQGIGKQAMNILLSEIWAPNVRITVEVLTINHIGYLFWKSLGFQDYSILLEMLPEQRADKFVEE
jgi:GNAT superfamily N-acetyltransferase